MPRIKEKMWMQKIGDKMKKLFIYFSLTGNGDIVAETFKSKGYDIRKVISKIKYPKSKFLRIMYGGYRVCFNKKDKLVDFNSNISNYDEVVIGSPIWMDSICAPINSVLDKHHGKWQLKRHPHNTVSVKFWDSVVSEYTRGNYRLVCAYPNNEVDYEDGTPADVFFFEN